MRRVSSGFTKSPRVAAMPLPPPLPHVFAGACYAPHRAVTAESLPRMQTRTVVRDADTGLAVGDLALDVVGAQLEERSRHLARMESTVV